MKDNNTQNYQYITITKIGDALTRQTGILNIIVTVIVYNLRKQTKDHNNT